MIFGQSQRLVRLAAAETCTTGCIRVASIQMAGKMIGFPRGQCTPRAFDYVTATLTVTDELGKALSGATVTGRFLDDYYLDELFTATTGSKGMVSLVHKGLACVGAITILIDDVTKSGRVLYFTTGTIENYVIPRP